MSGNHKDCQHEEHEEKCSMQSYSVSQSTVEVFARVMNFPPHVGYLNIGGQHPYARFLKNINPVRTQTLSERLDGESD